MDTFRRVQINSSRRKKGMELKILKNEEKQTDEFDYVCCVGTADTYCGLFFCHVVFEGNGSRCCSVIHACSGHTDSNI